MKKINLKSVDINTWIRTIVLVAALANQALVIFGINNKTIETESVTYYASYILTALSSVWSWWKNNSFTEKAQQADAYLYSENGAEG